MDRWRDCVAVVTGASSGIGAALVVDLIRSNVIVVGLARREERMREIRSSLPVQMQPRFHLVKCDVASEEDVIRAFKWIDDDLGGTDILINNAGCSKHTRLIEKNNANDILAVVNTNIMGIVYCTREAFASMKRRKIDGHIVNINSIAGHRVPNFGTELPSFNIYPATKYAVTAMTETLRQEFMNDGTKIKITSISPGACDTEIFPLQMKEQVKQMMTMLRPEDVSHAIIYCLSTPPHVQIHELTIKPVGEKC